MKGTLHEPGEPVPDVWWRFEPDRPDSKVGTIHFVSPCVEHAIGDDGVRQVFILARCDQPTLLIDHFEHGRVVFVPQLVMAYMEHAEHGD